MLWARTAQLRADAPDALPDGEPRSRGEDADRPHERSPRREHEADGDHDDPFRPTADADVAAQAERLRAGARVADQERPGDGGEREPDADEVVVAREDERDRPEDDALADRKSTRLNYS